MNPEDLITDALRERTEQADYPSTPLATVTARAGRLRARRRRTTVLAAAAAVAAVAVPGAVWLGRSPSSSPSPTGVLSSGPTSSPTRHGSAAPPLSLGSLPRGAKPGIDYLVGDSYVAMGGGSTTAPAFAHATTAALGRAGILVSALHGALAQVSLVSGQTSHALGCGAPSFAISADRTQSAYWVMGACRSGGPGRLYTGTDNTMAQGGPGYVTTPPGRVIEPVGYAPSGVVVNVEDAHGGDRTPVIEQYSGTPAPLSALQWVGGTSQPSGLISGISAAHADTGVVIDSSTGRVISSVPHWQLGQFSSDGKYVLGSRSGGATSDRFGIFDATSGAQVATLAAFAPHTNIEAVAWDSGDEVLAVVSDGSDQAIVRFDLQGHASLATPIRHVTGSAPGYRFAARP